MSETRTVPAAEIRFSDAESGVFEGYASLWDVPDDYGDLIRRGAFSRSLSERRPALLWSHDPSQPIGAWTSLVEDERGLRVTGKLVTETARGAEALALLRAGAVDGLSIGFRARKAERGADGARVLTDIELIEISIVASPAASQARVVAVRHTVNADRLAAFVMAVSRAAAALKGNSNA